MPKALQQACSASHLQQQTQNPLQTDVVLFEAAGTPTTSLDQRSSEALLDRIRIGGSLLFSFQTYPGSAAYSLSEALPFTGWTSQQRPSPEVPGERLDVKIADTEFFGGQDLSGLTAPPGIDIRPKSAVERGQSRYERYRFLHPVLKTPINANSDLWSKSLLNREWNIRAYYATLARLPLLVTGKYGAGRVALLATSAQALGETAAAQAFWHSVLRWLCEGAPASSTTSMGPKPSLAMSFPSSDMIRLSIRNASGKPERVQLITRILDSNGAALADGAGELQRSISLPAGPFHIDLPLPKPVVPGLETRESELTFSVRAGLLSSDGSSLLAETRAISTPPPLQIALTTESLYASSFPFPGPDMNVLDGFRGRMGLHVSTYAYIPGATVRGSATIRLQCRNVAPHAQIRDLNKPENASIIALQDYAAGIHRQPNDHIEGYGMWTGQYASENRLEFHFPEAMRLSSVTIVGSFGSFVVGEAHNPGQASVEIDGRTVAMVEDLDALFKSGLGQARIPFQEGGITGKSLTLHFPWIAVNGRQPRQEPWIGEVLVDGWPASEPQSQPVKGKLSVVLEDALSKSQQTVLEQMIALESGGIRSQDFTFALPDSSTLGIYRLKAAFHPDDVAHPVAATTPVLAITPKKTLANLQEITGSKVFGTGLIVTHGFTQFISLGTGTSEPLSGWSHADDLIWAYSRQMKEIPANARTAANRLYTTETDMRHYSTPWREFSNGEPFFQTATPGLVQYLKAQRGWHTGNLVRLTFADRWVVGPDLRSCNSWQEYIAFDTHLRENGGAGLDGRTHAEVEQSIHNLHESEWQFWQLNRYVASVNAIRDVFSKEKKDVVIYSQCIPAVAGSFGRELAKTIRGMNDDSTWSMQDNNPMLTTGRTLATLAFNPVWQISALQSWGFVSPVFNNWQWHAPVGTIEPNRRMVYDSLLRGVVWDGGVYGGAFTYGYGTNVGATYTMTAEEYQQWWYMQQRGSLLQPESPLGAGLVISSQKNATAHSARWNGSDPTTLAEVRLLMSVFRAFCEAGVSIPFVANASTLADWTPPTSASLIVLNVEDFNQEELDGLAKVQRHGNRIAAFASRSSLSSAATELFKRPGMMLLDLPEAGLTPSHTLPLARQLIGGLEIPLTFSEGLSGYGFRCQGLNFAVVEDWAEQTRMGKIQLRKSPGASNATAANLNDHSPLAITERGVFWEISVPVRSGDGMLLVIQES